MGRPLGGALATKAALSATTENRELAIERGRPFGTRLNQRRPREPPLKIYSLQTSGVVLTEGGPAFCVLEEAT